MEERINNKNQEYISLQDATQFCDYSQEYLSLRARRKKLKAVKFGRNWVTTKDWLEEYFQKVNNYKESINNKNYTAEFVKSPPPENLPVGELREFKKGLSPETLRPAFIFGFAFVLLIAGSVFGKDSLPYVYKEVSNQAEKFIDNFENTSDQVFVAAVDSQNIFKEYGQWMGNQILEIQDKYFAAKPEIKMPKIVMPEFLETSTNSATSTTQ